METGLFFKTKLRDYFTAAAAFYAPIVIVSGTLLLLARFYAGKGLSVFYVLNGIIPGLVSVYIFARGCRNWTDKPSPFLFFLGTWMAGPISLVAGVHLGFMPGLFLLTFYYLILQVVLWVRKKISFRSAMVAFVLSFFIFGFFLYASFLLKSVESKQASKPPLPKKISDRVNV